MTGSAIPNRGPHDFVAGDVVPVSPSRTVLRLVVVAGPAATFLLKRPLWQARAEPPLLPLVALPAWPFGVLLLASLALAVVRPVTGVLLHVVLLLLAIVADQTRGQPQVLSLAVLLAATMPKRGARELGALHLVPAAGPLLVRATTDSEPSRAVAAEQILLLPAATPEALAAVVARLDDKDPLVCHQVLVYLVCGLQLSPEQGQRHAALAREQILRLLTSENPDVRTTCADCQWHMLARRVERDPITDPGLYDGFSSLMYDWGIQKRPATEARVFRDAASLAAWALPFTTDARPYLRCAAAQVLGQLPSSPASRDALTRLAADADPLVRRVAVTALGWHGPEARACHAVLGKALHDSDWFVRAAAASALRAVHTK